MNAVKFRLVITVCQQKETSIFGHETRHERVEKKVLEAKPSIDCLQSAFFLKIRLVLSYRNCQPRHYVTMRDFLLGLTPSFIAARVPGFLLQ